MLGNAFWNLYALCYDGLNGFNPYKKLLEKVMEAADLQPGHKILDAGCGTGNFEALIEKKAVSAEVTGADFSPAMLARAGKKCSRLKAEWKKVDLTEPLPFSSEEFDRIISVNSFYNLTNHDKVLKEFNRVLKTGGLLVLVTPKNGSLPSLILKAHRHVHESDCKWTTDSFLTAIRLVFRAFGPTVTAIKFIFIAIFNKMIAKNLKEFGSGELRVLLEKNDFTILDCGTVYGNQNLFFVVKKN